MWGFEVLGNDAIQFHIFLHQFIVPILSFSYPYQMDVGGTKTPKGPRKKSTSSPSPLIVAESLASVRLPPKGIGPLSPFMAQTCHRHPLLEAGPWPEPAHLAGDNFLWPEEGGGHPQTPALLLYRLRHITPTLSPAKPSPACLFLSTLLSVCLPCISWV